MFNIDRTNRASACAKELRAAGFRALVFRRVGNPLDFDSAVRPKRDTTKCERLASTHAPFGTKSLKDWLWCEHAYSHDEWDAVEAIARRHGFSFSSIGFPTSGADSDRRSPR